MARAVSEEDLLLRKRARRRLVGAIALVIMAIVILPMVLDRTPKPKSKEIEIIIPSESLEGNFSSNVVPETSVPTIAGSDTDDPTPAVQREEKKEPDPMVQSMQSKKNKANKSVSSESSSRSNSDLKKSTTAEVFVVQLGAFSDLAKAKHQQRSLTSNGIKQSYTETLKNNNKEITRVRIGPFSTREAAENERKKLKKLGLDGVVMSK